MQFTDFKNVHAMIKSVVDNYGDTTAYKWFIDNQGNRDGVTFLKFYEQVKMVSKSLMALGLEKGDKVCIISNTCYQWALSDIGIICAGGCTVGIYQSNLPKDCEYIIDHSDGVLVIVEDNAQLQKALEIRKNIPKVRKVIMIKDDYPGDDWVMSFDSFLRLGKKITDDEFIKRTSEIQVDDPATIVYTSGTTGVPKGAVITQDNLIFNAQGAKAALNVQEGEETLLFLPLAHVMARVTIYAAAISATTVTMARSLDTAVEDIGYVRPDWLPSVPRVYEKIYSKVVSGAQEKGGIILKLFNWALKVGDRVSDCKINKEPIPGLLGLQYKIATKLVFSKLQNVLGGRIKWMLSGGAPLNESIAKFFHAADILVLEGIGMTENTSFSHTNRRDKFRFGWVGTPGVGVEHKLGDDGEIMIRGRNVMKEYYKMPEETAKTITKDGWLLTGDIGEIDSENFLKVTGRKKEIIITAGGKNIAPAYIEGVIATSTYINQIMVIGDRRKYLSAVVTVDAATVEDYANKNSIAYNDVEDLIAKEDVKKLIENEVAEKNEEFASYETIKKITIVPEFTIENGLITPTMKLKKNRIYKQYENEIDSMYQPN